MRYDQITRMQRVEHLIYFIKMLEQSCPATGGGCAHGDGNCFDFYPRLFDAYKAAKVAVAELKGLTRCYPCDGRGFFVPTDEQESQDPCRKHSWCSACDGTGRARLDVAK